MKKHLPLISILAVITLFTSCQKEPVNDQPTSPAAKVKTYTEEITSTYTGHIVMSYDLSYDASDRLINITSTNSPGTKILLTYASATKYSMDIYDANVITIHEDFYLNGNSFVDSTFQYNDSEDSSTEKYVYNAANQLTKLYEYDYSKITGGVLSNTTTSTYNTDGDLVNSTDTYKNTDTYEYYTDLSYATPLVIGPININSAKKSHLIKKHTLTSNGSVIAIADYTYTFDSDDRISTEKETFTDGTIFIKSYTYF